MFLIKALRVWFNSVLYCLSKKCCKGNFNIVEITEPFTCQVKCNYFLCSFYLTYLILLNSILEIYFYILIIIINNNIIILSTNQVFFWAVTNFLIYFYFF